MPGDLSAALVAGFCVGVGGFIWLISEALGRKRSQQMEGYLRSAREAGANRGQRSTTQVMAALGMTAGQVLDAARRSRAIKRLAITANANSSESAIFEIAPY